ncbi:MAG: ABC-2 type transport system ATP-binding protein [Gammaproteobacteria bacterium]|jgi:ABC-2 type transport system ATP-binding protein
MNEYSLVFNSVIKRYGVQEILSGVDLKVESGEYLGLVGINGAGKTTMIKCLLDLASISSGSISIYNQPNSETLSRESLAFLPEKFTPPYYLTGAEFIKYMLNLYGKEVNVDHINEMLFALDFNIKFLDKPVRQLSKGMMQKLGLAACFLSDRKLFILDEPMSGLDPKARVYLKKYLAGLKEKGKTMFFSTHLLADVEAICDRVAILHEGRIRFTGSPGECCRQFNAPNFESAYLACVE